MGTNLQKIIRFAFENGASDVHLQAAAPPMMRISGQMRSAKTDPLTDEQILEFITGIVPESARCVAEGREYS